VFPSRGISYFGELHAAEIGSSALECGGPAAELFFVIVICKLAVRIAGERDILNLSLSPALAFGHASSPQISTTINSDQFFVAGLSSYTRQVPRHRKLPSPDP
jgi:hypothetical protein